MALIVKYKFDKSIYDNLIPRFNSGFTNYTVTDEVVEGNIVTRVIEHENLKPTVVKFGNSSKNPENDILCLKEISYLDTSNINSMLDMCANCTNLIKVNTEGWDTSNVTDMYCMFHNCSALTTLNVSNLDTSNVTNMSNTFANCSQLTQLDVSNWNTSKVTTMRATFSSCSQLTQLDVSNWDTRNVTDMYYMFHNCSSFTQLDISNLDTSKVTNMEGMFYNCSQLTQLNVSNLDTSKVTNMGLMFRGCTLLTSLDVSNFDTSKVTTMWYMFGACTSLTSLDVSNWDTSKVTNMNLMFLSCRSLTSLDVSKWDTSNVTKTPEMFHDCRSLTTLDVSKWNTDKITNMQYMFRNCYSLTSLDASNWDTSNVTEMQYMFDGCESLTSLDVSNWDASKVTNTTDMFNACKVKNVGLIYCSKETIDKLANCITAPCNFYVTNKTYTSPNPLVKYVIYREDKKHLLYYNDETQTWEKPILRQWDSIEKHSDGKYYYHQRSAEVVLDGDEDWAMNNANNNGIMSATCNTIGKVNGNVICDKLASSTGADTEGILLGKTTGKIMVCLDNKKLSTQDIKGFKAWLQTNNVTVVYQLAEEKVYECTDLDLVTYTDTTSLMVERGVIAPKTTLKKHQNIANITSILQEKVSVLENNVGYATEIFVGNKVETINNEIDNVNTDLIGVSESIEGSSISVDSKDGYLKDVEILGNTIQNQNDLADIRSVGDKLENQELYEIPVLSCGKNLFDEVYVNRSIDGRNGVVSDITMNRFIPENFIRCKANTPYTIKITGDGVEIRELYYYNLDGSYIGVVYNSAYKTLFTFTPTQDVLLKWQCKRIDNTDIPVSSLPGAVTTQLEEGIQATPYEPYIEDKLTILSPTPLEKVGDVADRIICKDGVFGVEKWISKLRIRNFSSASTDTAQFAYNYLIQDKDLIYRNLILQQPNAPINNFVYSNGNDLSQEATRTQLGIFKHASNHEFRLRLLKSDYPNLDTVSKLKEYLESIDFYVMLPLIEPQFIPLPYDQQVKLRTFVNKTNISFGCEIEPTLKASVPKSIGASVSSNTTQIDNISKELQKINNLEESVTSEVVSESDFISVEDTSNGYFKDVKLEGRTLVNLAYQPHLLPDITHVDNEYVCNSVTNPDYSSIQWTEPGMFKFGQTYTIIFTARNTSSTNIELVSGYDMSGSGWSVVATIPTNTSKRVIYTKQYTNTNTSYNLINLANRTTGTSFAISDDILILEGDHTQNPPEFFEGLKSVGQDVDDMSVLSANDNLVNYLDKSTLINNGVLVDGYLKQTSANLTASARYNVVKGEQYTFAFDIESNIAADNLAYCLSYGTSYASATNKKHIGYAVGPLDKRVVIKFTATEEYVYLILGTSTSITVKDISLNLGNTDGAYTLPKQDKKRILYYNDETQAWEKPVLREWDSIEKHSDGKYYYHKRSEEVVLNGSRGWTGFAERENTVKVLLSNAKDLGLENFITDKYIVKEVYSVDVEGVQGSTTNGNIFLSVNKNKLSEVSLQGVKNYLNSNPFTMLYKLSTEKVYECTDLDLITYSGETNLLVKSGVLNPKVSLKVSNGVGNVVAMLQNKVTMLEQMVYDLMKMFNNQQSNIDE